MRAAITTGDKVRPVAVAEVDPPVPLSNQSLVRVYATSLNSGEVRRAMFAEAGSRVGWDVAGVVESAAADGTGPPAGTHVVAFVEGTGWAERVAVPAQQLGKIPDGVSFADAATLPIAGLTALRALRRGGDLIGKRVLIVPGTGGVGLFAVQLASLAGARVTAVVRNAVHVSHLAGLGAEETIVGSTEAATAAGPYDLILESLGGASLGAALEAVAPEGCVVSFGSTVDPAVSFDARKFFFVGGASLYGFIIFHEVRREPMARDLERLAELILDERLATHVEATFPLSQIGDAVDALRDRKVKGKIVVTLAT